ncbi:MAG: preprotein translocase subunit SecG [Candidatus Saccharibacteria bacterium]|nr:preprotein translocase subunit SecG [Candidatus Saccharibacteria bacterium]MCY4010456.1 preprotein translocase subunit SecG [Candidatus Saccharibacteria bacterium]MCY4088661.1 preprotein translocase subunit SecG [Candidatus Saccharibacteria bacterium]
MDSILDYIVLISGILLISLILMQTRGATLGAGLGGGGESGGSSVRRGSEKTIHQITILLVVIFSVSLMAGLLIS